MVNQKILAATASEVRRRDRAEDWGYTNLSGTQLSTLINYNQKDIIEDINTVYLKNPLAARIIRAKTNYVVGDGFNFQVEDNDDVQELLDNLWYDNKLNIKLETKVNDLSVNGEMIVLPEVSENAGKVILRFPFPGLLAEKKKRHKYDDEVSFFKLADDGTPYEIIYWNEAEEKYIGNAWLFYVNKPSHLDFGLSDIFDSRDWLKTYDKSLFATMSRVGLILSFVWDVLIKTKDPSVLKNKIDYIRKNPPVPGSARVHNESEIWTAQTPNLQGADMDKIYRVLKGQCMSGTGTPEFIFGLGGDTNYACHTEDTETLTENGWKYHWEIEPTEKIATYNLETKNMEYHIPEKKYLYDIDDDIYYIENVNVNMAITKNHEMLMSTSPINPYKKIKIQDIKCDRFCFLDGIDGFTDYNIINTFILPAVECNDGINVHWNTTDTEYNMKDWLEFLGIWISEGGIAVKDMIKRKTYHGTLIQKNEWERIKNILDKLNISYDMHDNKEYKCFNIYGKKLIKWLYDNTGDYCYNKKIPRQFLNLDRNSLLILFNSLMWGDGSWSTGEGRKNGNYTTTSLQLASDFQELAFKLGYRAKLNIMYESFMHNDGYTRRKCYRVSILPKSNHMRVTQDDISIEKYTGKVYCYNVKNHLFITRRNGKIGIHGNTSKTMLEPYFRDVKARQKYWQYIFETIFDYAIWQAKTHGMINGIKNIDDVKYTCGFAEPDEDKIKEYSDSLVKFANAAVVLTANGIIEKIDAQNVIKLLMMQIGVDITIEEDDMNQRMAAAVRQARSNLKKLKNGK